MISGLRSFLIDVTTASATYRRHFAQRAYQKTKGDDRSKRNDYRSSNNPTHTNLATRKLEADDRVQAEIETKDMIQRFERLEPNIDELPNVYSHYEKDKVDRKRKIGQWRMAKKHFHQFLPPSVSVLTYAEKEQIRYLHESDPQEWNAQTLAEAFPISAYEVTQLLKSPFRCLTIRDIQRHDQKVSETLEKIRNGEIELTPEQMEKMKIRATLPLHPGATSTPETGELIPQIPKKLGQFARIVTPNCQDETDEAEHVSEPGNKQKAANIYEPQKLPSSPDEELLFKTFGKARMSVLEFEAKMKHANETGKLGETQQQQFNAVVNSTPARNVAHKVASELNSESKPNDFFTIKKYKDVTKDSTIELQLEKGEAYIYKPETGYQKPFSSMKAKLGKLPANAVREGSVYRVGDSYFDENGEFLYRPV